MCCRNSSMQGTISSSWITASHVNSIDRSPPCPHCRGKQSPGQHYQRLCLQMSWLRCLAPTLGECFYTWQLCCWVPCCKPRPWLHCLLWTKCCTVCRVNISSLHSTLLTTYLPAVPRGRDMGHVHLHMVAAARCCRPVASSCKQLMPSAG
jgi:hypothetical protein